MTREKAIRNKADNRAFELDLLRGFAIFMMILHHFAYDLRYIFEYKVFSFISAECDWFWAFLHPFFIFVFVVISGICCQFSRNNFKRSLKLLIVALGFTVVTITADHFLDLGCSIYFNVLHLLFVSTLLFAVFDHFEQKKYGERNSRNGDAVLFLIVMAFFFLLNGIHYYHYKIHSGFVSILGIEPHPDYAWTVGDELGLIPWVGVFFLGVLIGRHVYKKKETLFPNAPKAVHAVSKPFEWIGRNSLLVYILHQPIVLGILYLLRYVGVLK
ncbi:MAG: DUF1624 domain-containing protein [Clostridiales bacterium]|nr:DUF1624 domain-containing protein [Clostridiales bacterium]